MFSSSLHLTVKYTPRDWQVLALSVPYIFVSNVYKSEIVGIFKYYVVNNVNLK